MSFFFVNYSLNFTQTVWVSSLVTLLISSTVPMVLYLRQGVIKQANRLPRSNCATGNIAMGKLTAEPCAEP